MSEVARNTFIANTALDYDMSIEDVEVFYGKFGNDADLFHEELESFIKSRADEQ